MFQIITAVLKIATHRSIHSNIREGKIEAISRIKQGIKINIVKSLCENIGFTLLICLVSFTHIKILVSFALICTIAYTIYIFATQFQILMKSAQWNLLKFLNEFVYYTVLKEVQNEVHTKIKDLNFIEKGLFHCFGRDIWIKKRSTNYFDNAPGIISGPLRFLNIGRDVEGDMAMEITEAATKATQNFIYGWLIFYCFLFLVYYIVFRYNLLPYVLESTIHLGVIQTIFYPFTALGHWIMQ